mgnify:CR=1 FL=1
MHNQRGNPQIGLWIDSVDNPPEIFYCYYGDEDADADDIKEWEIVEDLEENVQSAKFRIPAFMKLVFKWEQEDLERTITLPIKRISPNGIREEPL